MSPIAKHCISEVTIEYGKIQMNHRDNNNSMITYILDLYSGNGFSCAPIAKHSDCIGKNLSQGMRTVAVT